MRQSVLTDIHKIAVFRATALGDFIFVLPALDALRNTYPDAEIVYLGRTWHTAFLPGRLPGPLRVIAVPPAVTGAQISQGLVINPAAEKQFYQAMQAEGFDLALQMHGAGEYSNPFILNCHPRFSVGLKSPQAVPLDRWIPYVYYQNEVTRMLEVAGLVGAWGAPGDLQPHLPVLESDLLEAAPILEHLLRPFVVLHPSSTDPRRCWSPAKFSAVGDACAALGLQVVLIGTEIEAERVRAVMEGMQAHVTNLCGRLGLPGLVGLLSRADLFIGNDSGPLHLALSVGVRAVGLFWAEYIINSLPLLRENFYPLIAWRRICPTCGKYLDKSEADLPPGSCKHEVSFIEEIAPLDVIHAVEALLDAKRQNQTL